MDFWYLFVLIGCIVGIIVCLIPNENKEIRPFGAAFFAIVLVSLILAFNV